MKNFQNFLYEAESPIRRESNIDLSRAKVGDLIICKDNRGQLFLSKERIYKIESLDRENRIGTIDNEGKLLYTYYNRFDWVDKPEDNDYEEWVQESKKENRFKEGDRVICIDKDDYRDYYNRTGRVTEVDPKNYDKTAPYLVWVQFDHIIQVSYVGMYNYRLKLIDEEPEESNMEEWIQEEYDYNNNRFEFLDRVKKKNYDLEGYYLGQNSKDSKKVMVKWDDGDGLFINDINDIELIDKLEDTNMEKWVQESWIPKLPNFKNFKNIKY